MKTTIKQFDQQVTLRKQLKNWITKFEDAGKWGAMSEAKGDLHELQRTYFDKLKMVDVSFMIGYRSYFRSVVKIGNTYFSHSEKMTKSNGYRCVKEIEEITKKMKDSMISDSYYY